MYNKRFKTQYMVFCCVLLYALFNIKLDNVLAYNAISSAMSDYIYEEEEKIIINDIQVNETVTQTIEATNKSKFFEIILNEECDVDTVSYTRSFINYANVVTDKVLKNQKVHDNSQGKAYIGDKTKDLSVVSVNEFNTKVKYATPISDMDLFYKIVQAEAGCEDLKGKILVANVILNRVKSPKFPNSIRGVVMAPGQFQPVTNGKIYTVKVSNETKLAVDMALKGEDYSNGALYFMARSASSKGNVTWFDRALTRVVKHGNHEFFK